MSLYSQLTSSCLRPLAELFSKQGSSVVPARQLHASSRLLAGVKPHTEPHKARQVPKRISKAQKESLPPRKPLGSYIRFHIERMAKATPDEKAAAGPFGDSAKISAQAWNALSPAEKEKYAVPPAEVEEYKKKMAEWNATVDVKTLKGINKIRRGLGKKVIKVHRDPSPKTGSSFTYFIKEFAQKHLAADASEEERRPSEMFRRAAATWRTLSAEEKEVYQERRRKAVEEYEAARQSSDSA